MIWIHDPEPQLAAAARVGGYTLFIDKPTARSCGQYVGKLVSDGGILPISLETDLEASKTLMLRTARTAAMEAIREAELAIYDIDLMTGFEAIVWAKDGHHWSANVGGFYQLLIGPIAGGWECSFSINGVSSHSVFRTEGTLDDARAQLVVRARQHAESQVAKAQQVLRLFPRPVGAGALTQVMSEEP